MNSESDQTGIADQTAARAHHKWVRRDAGDHLQDWLEAEEEVGRLQVLTRRVAELEEQAELAEEADLGRQLAETESRLQRILAERRLAERRLVAMHAVAQFLIESGEFSKSGPRILRAICEALEWDVGEFWTLDRAANVLRCVEVWHAPTVEVDGFAQATRDLTFAPGVGLPGRIWASGKPAWIPDVTQDGNFLRTESAVRNGLRGGIGFPIHDGAEFLGVMDFFSREVWQPSQELLAMMSGICGQISQSIQRSRAEARLQREDEQRRLAREIQEGLLPKSAPPLPGFTIGARSWPSYDVGGDYFDAFLMRDGALALVIGDASGHAIGPALVIAATRAYIRAFAMTSLDPSTILTLANQRLCEDHASSHFVTLFFGRLDPRTGTLSYAGAGHCPGYVLSPEGQVKAALTSEGMPLGIDSANEYPPGPAAQLAADDLLFLYTDGIVEAGSEGSVGQFGIERTLDLLRAYRKETPDQILDAIYGAARGFSAGCDQADDMTAILVKVDAGNQTRVVPSAGSM
jgi:serine phosphatase RsbU (regulator of sigma subunit)